MKLTRKKPDLAGRTLGRSDIAPETLASFKKYDASPHDLCTVLDKFQVTPMLFELVGVALESIQRNLIKGEFYTPSELVGDENWGHRDGAWRREIELCLKHFANYPDFGLRATERGTFECVGSGRAA